MITFQALSEKIISVLNYREECEKILVFLIFLNKMIFLSFNSNKEFQENNEYLGFSNLMTESLRLHQTLDWE